MLGGVELDQDAEVLAFLRSAGSCPNRAYAVIDQHPDGAVVVQEGAAHRMVAFVIAEKTERQNRRTAHFANGMDRQAFESSLRIMPGDLCNEAGRILVVQVLLVNIEQIR